MIGLAQDQLELYEHLIKGETMRMVRDNQEEEDVYSRYFIDRSAFGEAVSEYEHNLRRMMVLEQQTLDPLVNLTFKTREGVTPSELGLIPFDGNGDPIDMPAVVIPLISTWWNVNRYAQVVNLQKIEFNPPMACTIRGVLITDYDTSEILYKTYFSTFYSVCLGDTLSISEEGLKFEIN